MIYYKVDEAVAKLEAMVNLLKQLPKRVLAIYDQRNADEQSAYIYISGSTVDLTPNNDEQARKLVGALQLEGWEIKEKEKKRTVIDVVLAKEGVGEIKISDWRPKTCRLVKKEITKVLPAEPAVAAKPERTVVETVTELVCDTED